MATFRGYSTVDKKFGNFVLEDIELAKRDLLNHFYTRKGERLGEPEFGSILPELVFEQLDAQVVELAEEDVINIINADPRWRLDNAVVETGEHSITVEVQLTYLQSDTSEELYLKYTTEEEI